MGMEAILDPFSNYWNDKEFTKPEPINVSELDEETQKKLASLALMSIKQSGLKRQKQSTIELSQMHHIVLITLHMSFLKELI